jgi:hypothetical protein
MAAPISDDMLNPGDLIAFEYEIRKGASETLIALAVHSIKQSIYNDRRLDYQSGRREYRTDTETGIVYEYLVVKAIVRKTLRADTTETQRAGVGTVAIGAVIALASAAVIAYSAALIYRSYVVYRVATNPELTEQEKRDAYEALDKTPDFLKEPTEAVTTAISLTPWLLFGAVVIGMYFSHRR